MTARRKGSAVITAKINDRTLKCKVVVNDTHKHHWAAYDDPQPENIFGVVCYCGKVLHLWKNGNRTLLNMMIYY